MFSGDLTSISIAADFVINACNFNNVHITTIFKMKILNLLKQKKICEFTKIYGSSEFSSLNQEEGRWHVIHVWSRTTAEAMANTEW